MSASRPASRNPAPSTLRHYVYLTDGTRTILLRQVTWHDDDIYLTDPNDPTAGKVSWHESGALNLGQPLYSPQKVKLPYPPPSAVHGYASPLRTGMNTHGLGSLLSRKERYPPAPERRCTIIDLRRQPEGMRFLVYEIGVRCDVRCHATARMPSGNGLLQELIPNGDRFLVVSAWWEPLLTPSQDQFETFLRDHGLSLERPVEARPPPGAPPP